VPQTEPGPRAYSYTFNFDHPKTWNTASNKLLILGWCYENSGAPIKGIRAHFGSDTVTGIYGSKRLDVLASTGMAQAEYSGIKIEIPTHLGDHALVVEVEHADGWHAYFSALVHVGKAGDPTELSEYEKWCEQHETLSEGDLGAIADHIAAFKRRPVISVVMPVFNPPGELLEKAIQSVVNQLYPHWELCVADDASTQPHVQELLKRFAAADPRIKVAYRTENGHICEATNTALGLVGGDYVALFDHDDTLSRTALYEVASEIDAHPEAQFIYSDEDKIDTEDRRFDPYFKPDWNPDLASGQNYTSHLSVYRTDLVRVLGGFRKGFEGSQDWDLFLRAVERIPSSAIRHIPKLLYHWRAAPGSTALQLAEKAYPLDAARRALEEHFGRTGENVELVHVPGDHWRVKHPVPSPPPFVSLIIPTRNSLHLVRQAVQSILTLTDYPSYEIVIVDNESDDPSTIAYLEELSKGGNPRVRVIPYHAPFNYSAINNFAVRECKAQVVGLLNSDVEVIEKSWLTEMVSQACRPGIGAVGAMLYYPTNTVQHAGVVLGLGGVAGHPYKDFPRGDQGQKNRLRLVQNYSAVTAACLVIQKDRYLEVGGLNEKDLAIAFNDVDLCCKLIKAGYRNLWTPYAELYHHESATRGVDNTPEKKARFQSEIDYMTDTWGYLLMTDPAYNPNLTLVGEDFSPAYLSRTMKPWMGYLR
jgi:glycosyltransferase involved in cell wall biosynthesis